MQRLLFVTGNENKFREVHHLITNSVKNYELIRSQEQLTEIQADSLSEVALFKVRSVMDKIKEPFFVEDAGFFVDDHLKGFPGVYSAYVMKSVGYDAILKILGPKEPRKAHFEAVIAYCDNARQIHLFKGENYGTVSFEARGSSGFGFDPVFISADTPEKTFAELTIEEKNKISHRRRALMQLIDFLKVH